MYEKDGDYGRVSVVTHKCNSKLEDILYTFTVAGWHECNDLYHINRLKKNPIEENEYLLLITISGAGTVKMNNRSYLLSKGSVALVKLDDPNEYYAENGDQWEFYFLHFKFFGMRKIYTHLLQNEKLVLNFSRSFELADRVQEIIEIKNSYLTDVDYACSGIISRMIHILLEHSIDTYIPDPMIVEITRYMRDHYSQKFLLQDLVDKFYVSKNYLCTLFKRHNFVSPYAYMTKIRIEESKKMLLMTSLSVAQISKKCGFSSPNNYISTFKKLEGITPNKFKRNMVV